ncbi:hypothetical protein BDA99DRAFT_511279 [Phascolomyces articulosus]|uniref:Endopeptidase S2P n=1 Tax=Phascolomyces articulosus TaxID=60185 RepID=A0AAD5PD12_9FUNG|nr:hypothetical protein BDA99DRAFT_511279 [Phascolomyces articulosus]
MDLIALAFQFIFLWAFIYIFVLATKFYIATKESDRQRVTSNGGILPTSYEEGSHSNNNDDSNMEKDQWMIKLFQVKYTTAKCNNLFRRIADAAPRFWNIWFAIGTSVAVVVMVAGVVVISYAALKILLAFWHILQSSTAATHSQQPTTAVNRYRKRSLEEATTTTSSSDDEQVFLPMIPGVTVPLSHLGYYLLALLVCGVFHEAGHAIAAYCQRVPIKSAGIFVYYIYPGAFVNISDHALHLIAPFRQLKIICAGVWHNIILYLWTLIMLAGGLKTILLLLGWQSLESSGGVSVVDVRPDSPLAYHLPISSILYKLDDFPLENNIVDWNQYLLGQEDQRHIGTEGFCAVVPDDPNIVNECCDIDDEYPFGRSPNSTLSCFRDFTTSKNTEPDYFTCLPMTDVMISQASQRCMKDLECSTGEHCVTPYTPSAAGQIVRVYTKAPAWKSNEPGSDKVFVFEGELVDIWESVKVGILRPRFWFLPVFVPHTIELLLRYISSFTLALALLNILPAFQLDGEYALGQLVSLALQRNNHSPVSTGRLQQPQQYTRKIVKLTSTVVGFVIIGSILLGLAR